jgi:hypothetical protein
MATERDKCKDCYWVAKEDGKYICYESCPSSMIGAVGGKRQKACWPEVDPERAGCHSWVKRE